VPDFYAAEYTLLRGHITLKDSGGEPVPGVKIDAFGANLTASDSFGKFELEFKKKSPGDRVVLRIKKEGLEVVNRKHLNTILRKDPDYLVEIVMCKKGDRDEVAIRYYGIREKFIKEIYKKGLNETKKLKNPKEKYTARVDADARRTAALAHAKRVSEKLAEVNLDKKSELFIMAFEPFTAGNIDKALRILEDEKIEQALRKEHAELQKKHADLYMLKARMLIDKYQFKNAEKYYQKAIEIDPKNVDNIVEFASFLYNQKKYKKALHKYKKALSFAMTDSQMAEILNYMGCLYLETRCFENALGAFMEALGKYKKLAEENRDAYLPYVADVLNDLATYYERTAQNSKASAKYNEALKIYRGLENKDPITYSPCLAKTLVNLGVIFYKTKLYKKALAKYNEALKIYRRLTSENQKAHFSDMSWALNNLGNLHRSTNRFSEAETAYSKALDIRRQLAKTNHRAFDLYVSNTLISMSILYKARLDKENKESYRNQGLSLIKEAVTILKKYPYVPEAEQTLMIVKFMGLQEYFEK
jgi:tetratricopeptide (TPR) repeat protein